MALTDYGLLTLATLGLTLAAIYVALYIAYQAYRGLRRHDSTPMRYLSVGILLLFGVTYTVSFAGTVAFRYSLVSLDLQPAFRFLVRLLQLAGLGAVAYSLYLVRTQEPTLTATADGGLTEPDRTDVPAGAATDGSPADASIDEPSTDASTGDSDDPE
jgi:uncharacterized membrane protein YesL